MAVVAAVAFLKGRDDNAGNLNMTVTVAYKNALTLCSSWNDAGPVKANWMHSVKVAHIEGTLSDSSSAKYICRHIQFHKIPQR